MKLIHNSSFEINVTDEYSPNNDLRNNEEKFYKMFDINPCPMSIHDLETGSIIDVNQSFLDIIGLKKRTDIIGKDNFCIINDNDKKIFTQKVKNEGVAKNMPFFLKTSSNKKIKGLFSGTLLELNNIKYLLVICQVIDKKCLLNYILL
jgi:PAS domain S-box-containing protein